MTPLLLPVRHEQLSFRASLDDFVVEELPAYEPEGEGEHAFFFVEKRGISTIELSKRLARVTGLQERDIGFAGRKDARGVTRQWICAHTPRDAGELQVAFDEALGDDGHVIKATRHPRKLRLSHLRGNRFDIRLPVEVDDELRERAAQLSASGIPNFYGSQRFGEHTLDDARAFIARKRKARSRRERFWISAAQSLVFNTWLEDRLQDGSWREVLDGDVVQKHTTGGMFVSEDAAADTARALAGELSATGPMPGRKMRSPEREAMTRESRSFSVLGDDLGELSAHPAFDVGTRRLGRFFPIDLAIEGGRASFELPKGCYATVFLRELIGVRVLDDAPLDD